MGITGRVTTARKWEKSSREGFLVTIKVAERSVVDLPGQYLVGKEADRRDKEPWECLEALEGVRDSLQVRQWRGRRHKVLPDTTFTRDNQLGGFACGYVELQRHTSDFPTGTGEPSGLAALPRTNIPALPEHYDDSILVWNYKCLGRGAPSAAEKKEVKEVKEVTYSPPGTAANIPEEVTGFKEFMPNEAGYVELRRLLDYLREQIRLESVLRPSSQTEQESDGVLLLSRNLEIPARFQPGTLRGEFKHPYRPRQRVDETGCHISLPKANASIRLIIAECANAR
ncbi:uncharacterized protein F4807DRAFT_465702 [Annulohypoxylon truncatum]|uniref:uncharacterized protein n=1 Tax=Annulohypoxylon truncatum TaxID=327061 RepID=UPI0020073018|nr:uncharacterized protein F4807DRAFT_465702 [Annulohypoxylon truncatum]KAI1204468.1 hypothetical protein F4807DRAFT_465702 [Annulohypoxylon truncatum]